MTALCRAIGSARCATTSTSNHALLLHLLAYDVLVYGLPVHAPNDCKAALSLPARSPLAKPPVRTTLMPLRTESLASQHGY